jgi:hypothetical protein
MTIETFLTFGMLRQRVPTLEEFRRRLSGYDRRQMLFLCAAVSISLNFVLRVHTENVHWMWVRKLFATSDANVIIANNATVFHRHQLLFLMQEVVRFCPEIGEPPGTKLPFDETGEVFLMANDLINIPIPVAKTPGDSSLQLIMMLLPSMEANLFTNAIQRMARGHLIVTRIADLKQNEGTYFDIRESFLEATGITFEAFEALMSMVFTRLLNVEDVLKDASKFGIDEAYFANVPLPPETIKEFFSLVSATPEEYSAALAAENPRLNDLRVIRDRPLAKIENRYYPLDAHIGIEKFESAVYWSIFNHLPQQQKQSFASFWGAVFEDYVVSLFNESVEGRLNRPIMNPRYVDDAEQQVCDLIIQCDRSAIFIEVKGNTITSEAKYSGDLESLRRELERKWVGTELKRKGVRQLEAAIRDCCSDENPRRIDGIDMGKISTVIPLVITRDEFGGYMGVNTYLNDRFKEILGKMRCRKSITPLLCVCIDTIEKLSPYLEDTALSDLLSARLRADKKLSSPFFSGLGPFLKRKNGGDEDRRPSILKEATAEVSKVAAKVLGLKPTEGAMANAGAGKSA